MGQSYPSGSLYAKSLNRNQLSKYVVFSIREAKALDDLVFKEHQGISFAEINTVAEQDGLLGIQNISGKVITEGQIIYRSIPEICNLEPGTALCYGSAVHPSYRRAGFGRVLMKARESLAAEKV